MKRFTHWLTQEGGFDRVMVYLFLFAVCAWIGLMTNGCWKGEAR